ncbi:unnamed protein product [Mytilus edulis]|uniref:Uncharacterized protein n=1 Tax=Mytilus edulis TaxID=6550 RepID=A0A8S3UY91_MYTED|nr:unnamed protein product [Mytilus edulis]
MITPQYFSEFRQSDVRSEAEAKVKEEIPETIQQTDFYHLFTSEDPQCDVFDDDINEDEPHQSMVDMPSGTIEAIFDIDPYLSYQKASSYNTKLTTVQEDADEALKMSFNLPKLSKSLYFLLLKKKKIKRSRDFFLLKYNTVRASVFVLKKRNELFTSEDPQCDVSDDETHEDEPHQSHQGPLKQSLTLTLTCHTKRCIYQPTRM